MRTPAIPGATSRLVEIQTADAGRIKIAVDELGEGPPVLMAHGWPQHAGCWATVAPRLARDHRVICPDLRGFGLSDAPGTGYDPYTFAADQMALLDALGLDRVHAVGHDWGGFALFLNCIEYPDRFAGYVATNTGLPWARPSLTSALQLWRIWYAFALSAPFVSYLVLTRRPGRMAKGISDEMHGAVPENVIFGYARDLARPASARATVALYRSYLRLAFTVAARRPYRGRRLDVPTHFLFGTEDVAVPRSYVDHFESHGDDLTLEWVPGAAHFLAEERPELVVQRARELFARTS